MSSGGQQPTQTTTQQISPQAQQLFDLVYPNLKNFAATTPAAYPGETVAGFTPTQVQAQQDILGGAQTAGQVSDWARQGAMAIPGQLTGDVAGTTPFVGQNLTTSSNIFNDPGIWNPQYNTGLSEAIQAAQRPTWQGLTEQALPAIRSGAVTAGGFGGSRQGLGEGLATGRATQVAADQAAKMAEDVYGANLGAVNQRYATNVGAENQRYGTNVGAETARYGTDIGAANQRYGQNINALLATYGLAPSLQQQALVPGFTTAAVGDVQQQMQQAQIDAAIQKWNFEQMAPFMSSQDIMAMIQGMPGGSTVATGNVPQSNPATMALGGAAAGAALGSAFMPGVGTAAGAGIGATLPFLFQR